MVGSLSQAQMAEQTKDGSSIETLVWIFVALQGSGCIGILILLITAWLSPSVKRYPTWYSLGIAWVIQSFTYMLLFIGGQQMNPKPDVTLCRFQASLVYACAVMVSFATLALFIQLWQQVSTVHSGAGPTHTRILMSHLIVTPYVMFIVMVIASAVVVSLQPDSVVLETGMFCGISAHNYIMGKLSSGLVILTTGGAVIFQGITAYKLIRNWRYIRQQLKLAGNTDLLSHVFRSAAFACCSLLAITTSIVVLGAKGTVVNSFANITIAFLPVSFWLMFGTQRDFARAWIRALLFWRPSVLPLSITSKELFYSKSRSLTDSDFKEEV